MKKYILTICYNEQDDSVEWLEEKIEDDTQDTEQLQLKAEENFFEQIDKMPIQEVNDLFHTAAAAGGILGDA